METFLSGLDLLMRWDVALALIIGSVGGVVIGAIPGVGAAVAIAILLPATFSLDPIVGLTVLLGIYGSSMYGGALPAVLINTPGTAVIALTTYDGYPMTKKGQARRALALAYSASFWGGIFGIVCLIFLSPLLALIAPHFGSREIFLAALLGIILVVLAHRGQIFAAGGLAAFGIFLHTVGLDVKYNQRMTFEQTWLTGGVDLIVVVLGLFALSQAFLLLTDTENASDPQSVDGSLLGSMKEILQHKRVAIATRLCCRISFIEPKRDPSTLWGSDAFSVSVRRRKAWLSAKRPSTTTIRSTPPVSHVCSKVMRWLYLTSNPTV